MMLHNNACADATKHDSRILGLELREWQITMTAPRFQTGSTEQLLLGLTAHKDCNKTGLAFAEQATHHSSTSLSITDSEEIGLSEQYADTTLCAFARPQLLMVGESCTNSIGS